MTQESALSDRIRLAGLRVTAPRLAVLAAVQGAKQHLDVQAIADAARTRLGTLSTQAVYDNLNTLVDAGLVRRIQPAGHPARYEGRIGDNHHHVVCRGCGTTADVDCAIGLRPCLEASHAHGFIIDEAEVTYWGLCPICQQTTQNETSQEQNHE